MNTLRQTFTIILGAIWEANINKIVSDKVQQLTVRQKQKAKNGERGKQRKRVEMPRPKTFSVSVYSVHTDQSVNFSLSLFPWLMLWRSADHMSKHVSLHLVCVWAWPLSGWATSSSGNNVGTGFSLVRAQSLHSGDVNKILGPGLDVLWGISVCRDTNKHMETARDWPYTDWLMSP